MPHIIAILERRHDVPGRELAQFFRERLTPPFPEWTVRVRTIIEMPTTAGEDFELHCEHVAQVAKKELRRSRAELLAHVRPVPMELEPAQGGPISNALLYLIAVVDARGLAAFSIARGTHPRTLPKKAALAYLRKIQELNDSMRVLGRPRNDEAEKLASQIGIISESITDEQGRAN